MIKTRDMKCGAGLVFTMLLLSCGSQTEKNKPVVMQSEKSISIPDAWQKFRQTNGDWSADWNEATGTPHRAIGPSIAIAGFSKINRQNIEEAAIRFLSDNQAAMGIKPDRLKLVKATQANNRWYVSYKQIENNLEVLNSEVELRIFNNGMVMAFGADFFSNIDVSPEPTVSIEMARKQAVSAMDFNPGTNSATSDKALYYLPKANGEKVDYYLVYQITVKTRQPATNFVFLVDAHSGEVRERHNLIRESN